jgi:hypothetical protein
MDDVIAKLAVGRQELIQRVDEVQCGQVPNALRQEGFVQGMRVLHERAGGLGQASSNSE